MRKSDKTIIWWILTIAAGVGLGLLAAQVRLFDSTAGVIGLGIIVAILIGLGLRAMMAPWDEWEE
ncbi:MAG: hypothetical protein U1F68_06445 [Gammaproteobacteria bacterium]